jgi:hypothetical protein
MREIVKVTTWDSPTEFSDTYTIREDNKYLVCNSGAVFCNDKYATEVLYINDELEEPFSVANTKWVMEIDGRFGVYNDNFVLLRPYDDVYDFLDNIDDWNLDQFETFQVE